MTAIEANGLVSNILLLQDVESGSAEAQRRISRGAGTTSFFHSFLRGICLHGLTVSQASESKEVRSRSLEI